MSETFSQPRLPFAPAAAMASEVSAPVDVPVTAPTLPVSASRAVEAVLGVVERMTAGDRHSVELQFSVGGADLKVQVVLRDAEVHATFRTDEPELRTALAQEWQAITSAKPESDRSWRFAAPTFAGGESAGSFARSGDDAPRQDAHPQRQSEFTVPVVSRRRAETRAPSAVATRGGHSSGASLLETQA